MCFTVKVYGLRFDVNRKPEGGRWDEGLRFTRKLNSPAMKDEEYFAMIAEGRPGLPTIR